MAGLKGGLTLTIPNASLPFLDTEEAGFEVAHGGLGEGGPFPEKGQAVSAQGGRCAELLLPGRPWKWGSQRDVGTRDWLSRAHGCNTLQTGVRACR